MRVVRALTSCSWDNLLPVATLFVFGVMAIPVGTGALDFGLSTADANRIDSIYTDIGVQTTAGIFAIVISLSLVAIQVAAQEYSHRIMDYYIKSTVFWTTITVHLGVMVSAIFLLAGSTEDDGSRKVALILLGSVLALTLLVPHFVITAAYLKPDFIVLKLMSRVTPQYLARVAASGHETVVGTSRDRLLPVIEIAERSIERGDTATANFVISQISGQITTHGELDDSPYGAEKENELAVYLIAELHRIARKAISHVDEEAVASQAVRAIASVGRIGALSRAISTIDYLLFGAVRHQQESTIAACVQSLSDLYPQADDESRVLIGDSFNTLIPKLVGEGHRLLSRHLVNQIGKIAEFEEPGGLRHRHMIRLLEQIGREGAAHQLMRVTHAAAAAMEAIGTRLACSNPASAKVIVAGLAHLAESVEHSDERTLSVIRDSQQAVEQSLALAGN